MIQDAEVRRNECDHRPYERLILQLFIELTTPGDQLLEQCLVSVFELFWCALSFVCLPICSYISEDHS